MDEFHFYADPDRGWAWQVPLIELPRAQFVLMSATLGDVSRFERDLTRRTGRPDRGGQLRGAAGAAGLLLRARPRCTRRSRSCSRPTQAPIYVVHFTQAARGRAGAGADEHQRVHPRGKGRDRRADRRLPVHRRASARRCRGWSGTASACTTPACCPGTGGWWRRCPGRACSRSSAAPTPSASASTCRSAPCCSPRCPSTTAPRPGCCRRASSTRSLAGRAGPASTPRRRGRAGSRARGRERAGTGQGR